MSNANPVEWDDNLEEEVFLLSQEEMKMLERGSSHEEVMQHKLDMLKKQESELIKRKKTAKSYRWHGEDDIANANIKYKIKSIEIEDDKAVVTIDIHDVVPRGYVGGREKEEPATGNYLKGEMKGMNQKIAEDRVKIKVRELLRDYMKTRFRYNSEDPRNPNIVFKFNHLKQ
jgi:hypothetical protein